MYLPPIKQPHARLLDEILQLLNSDKKSGLSKDNYQKNLNKYGQNVIPQKEKLSAFHIFINQFKSFIVLILAIAALISYIYDHTIDAYIILAILSINAIVGFIQEYQAEKSIEVLKNLLVPRSKVIRNNQIISISSQSIVPGDIILLQEGDHVPADARIIEVKNLEINESMLTGESLSVIKESKIVSPEKSISEQNNMVWMGSLVISGSAQAVVVATGTTTVLGQIADNISSIDIKPDHFRQKTDQLAKQMSIIALFSTLSIFFVGFFIRKFEFEEIFMFSVASLVSAIPEGLPVILTVILALGAKRMSKKNAIVRRLSATETLAVVDTIITDKTGTLTQNKMQATNISYYPNVEFSIDNIPENQSPILQLISNISKYCHDVREETGESGEKIYSGDPTEVAISQINSKIKFIESHKLHIFDQIPFSRETRVRATAVSDKKNKEKYMYVIGSPESVISQCRHILSSKNYTIDSKDENKKELNDQLHKLTNQGQRVIALAIKTLPIKTKKISKDLINNLTFVSFVGISDPPRPEVKEAIKQARQAGIRVIMATGDHPLTARAIGIQLGLIPKNTKISEILTEENIAVLSNDELAQKLSKVKIFARMTPTSKMRITKILQSLDHVVAMTGDGVNDAPALQQADIGIGMGKKGTDVAREASDIILADDNFATIITAIGEGRTQLRNVRRTSFFYITTNLAQSLILLIFLFIGFPLPLLPKQILWLNIVTAGVTDLALATEPTHDDVLNSPPHSKRESILNRKNIPFLVTITITISLLAYIVFSRYLSRDLIYARTMLFIVLSLSQIYNMFNMRSLKKSIFNRNIFSGVNVNIAAIFSFGLMLMAIYNPFFNKIFDFTPVRSIDLLIATFISLFVIVVSEIYKAYKRK